MPQGLNRRRRGAGTTTLYTQPKYATGSDEVPVLEAHSHSPAEMTNHHGHVHSRTACSYFGDFAITVFISFRVGQDRQRRLEVKGDMAASNVDLARASALQLQSRKEDLEAEMVSLATNQSLIMLLIGVMHV